MNGNKNIVLENEPTSCGSSIMNAPRHPLGDGVSQTTPPLQFVKSAGVSLWLEEIPIETAAKFVREHHYSKVMPKQTKLVLGAFKGKDGPLIGVITFGWGVRPKDTLRALFPSLDNSPDFTKQYLEIGKMCVHDSEPKNTESHLLSLAANYIKKHRPEVKLIFTWADALWGKPGYVYQAANYYYGGFIWTDVYTDEEGIRMHPRQLPKYVEQMLKKKGYSDAKIAKLRETEWRADNGIGVCRPDKQMLVKYGLRHVFGMQFRYVFFLCDKKEQERLIADSANERMVTYVSTKSKRLPGIKGVEKTDVVVTVKKKSVLWTRGPYPKASSMEWKIDDGKPKDGKPSKPLTCPQPKFGEAFDPKDF